MTEAQMIAGTRDPGDLIQTLTELTLMLQSAGAAFQTRNAKALDRVAAIELAYAANQVAIRVEALARATARLERRRMEGLTVGYFDRSDRRWFVHHAHSWGNVFRTDAVELAAAWPDVPNVKEWIRKLSTSKGEDAKGKPWPAPARQFDDVVLHAFPIKALVGSTVYRFETQGPLHGQGDR